MNRRLWLMAMMALSPALPCAVTACSSDPASGPQTQIDAGSDASVQRPDAGGGAGRDGGAPTTDAGTSHNGDAGTSEVACSKTTTAKACLACCRIDHANGPVAFQQAQLACACQAGAEYCKSVCATSLCAATPSSPDGGAGDPCFKCINDTLQQADGGAGSCQQQVVSACAANADCVGYLTCANQQCAGKP